MGDVKSEGVTTTGSFNTFSKAAKQQMRNCPGRERIPDSRTLVVTLVKRPKIVRDLKEVQPIDPGWLDG